MVPGDRRECGRVHVWPYAVAVALLGLVALTVIYHTLRPGVQPIRSDGIGYYVYLPQVLLHHDPKFLTLPSDVTRRGMPLSTYGLYWNPETARYVDKYQVGEAVLLLPFFAVAHVVAAVSHAPRTGFSWPYQWAVAAAGLSYLALGVGLLARLLGRTFSRRTVSWTIVVIVFATDLFHYGTFDGVFSHVYSFSLLCALVIGGRRWAAAPTWRSTVMFGAGSGLFVLVRATNLILLISVGVVVAIELRRGGGLSSELKRRSRQVATIIAVAALTFTPQLALWKLTANHWVIYSYQHSLDERLVLGHPHIGQVLFSVEKGLFFWSPILLLACAGVIYLRRYDRGFALGAAVVLPLNAYVISSWTNWSFGGSFGHRAFVESLPLFAMGYAAFIENASGVRRRAVLVLSVFLVGLSVVLMVRYWQGALPYQHVTWRMFERALWLGSRA